MMAKGVEYLLRAGNRAGRLFANEEGIAHYRRGIAPVTMLQTTPRPAQMELALQPAPVIPLILARAAFRALR